MTSLLTRRGLVAALLVFAAAATAPAARAQDKFIVMSSTTSTEQSGLFKHLLPIFKQATGLSPHQYILHRRIERAKELLSDHRRNLAGIALESGFGSQSHFGTIFRRLTGCTPKKFRQLAAA